MCTARSGQVEFPFLDENLWSIFLQLKSSNQGLEKLFSGYSINMQKDWKKFSFQAFSSTFIGYCPWHSLTKQHSQLPRHISYHRRCKIWPKVAVFIGRQAFLETVTGTKPGNSFYSGFGILCKIVDWQKVFSSGLTKNVKRLETVWVQFSSLPAHR